MARSRNETESNRAEAIRDWMSLRDKYREGTSMTALTRIYGVEKGWLVGLFKDKGEPIRNPAEAARLQARQNPWVK